jgi:hypothetical protein
MTVQFGICVRLVSVLILLPAFSTRARSLAAIDDSVTRGRITWNATGRRQKRAEARNLEEFKSRAPIESSGRGAFGRIRHYVGTHKELLASDALFIAALSADAFSTVRCQHMFGRDCVEENRLLPDSPSEFEVWGYFTGEEALYITAIHLWWHRNPDSPWRHIDWAIPIAESIYEIPNVRYNWDFGSDSKPARLQEARARVSR